MGNLCCVQKTYSTPTTPTPTYVPKPTSAAPAPIYVNPVPKYIPVPVALNNPQINDNFPALDKRQAQNGPGRHMAGRAFSPEQQAKEAFRKQQKDLARKIEYLLRRQEELQELLRKVHSVLEQNKILTDIAALNNQIQTIRSQSTTSGVTPSICTTSSRLSTTQGPLRTRRSSAPEIYNSSYTSTSVLPELSRRSSGTTSRRYTTASSRTSTTQQPLNTPITTTSGVHTRTSGTTPSRYATTSSRTSTTQRPLNTPITTTSGVHTRTSGTTPSRYATTSSRTSTTQQPLNTPMTTRTNTLPELSRKSSGAAASTMRGSTKYQKGY